MEKLKKNLPVILLSVIATLLLVIVIILLTSNKGFKLNNNSSKESKEKEKITEVKEKENKESEETNSEAPNEENQKVDEKKETTKEVAPIEKEEKSEEKLITYFQNEENLFSSNNSNNESLTGKLKDSFVGIIDFIFYDKEVNGYTFKELTNSAKLKTIALALKIDNKIDSYFPNYKDKIKDKYTEVKGKLALKYLEVTANFCEKNTDTCIQAKEDFSNMKESFGFTWDLLKEMAKNGSNKIKEFYEGWKDK